MTELLQKNWSGGRWQFIAWMARETHGAITPDMIVSAPPDELRAMADGVNRAIAAENGAAKEAAEAAKRAG